MDAMLCRRLMEIVKDGRPVRDSVALCPGLKAVTHGVHVAIGADAWVTEKIPGAPKRFTPLQDEEVALWALALKMIGRANTAEACSYDEDVDVLLVDDSRSMLWPACPITR